jgi:ADP-ribose pyrophosphatase YjhB (NUDIX family)
MSTDYRLTPEEFDSIYSKVPRLTVEVVVRNATGAIYLAKRAIEPCKGQWHLPGGTVYYGESMLEAVRRVAKRELGITVTQAESRGFIEYPSHYRHGMDQPVGLVFEVVQFDGELQVDDEASEGGWFTSLPTPMHADQDDYLVANYAM